MKTHTQAIVNDMGTLVEDARGLMAATADVAGEKVSEARERLAHALTRKWLLTRQAKSRVADLDRMVHAYPLVTLGRCSAQSN